MRDPIRRKLDAHAARHVPATTDLWPALRRRIAAQSAEAGHRRGGHRRSWAGLRAWAGAGAAVALALAVLVVAAALFGAGGRRAASGGAPVPALAGAPRAAATPGGTPTRSATAPDASPDIPGAGCADPAVTAPVARFLDAYNAGDQARLLALFPAQAATRGHLVTGEATYFQWYADTRKPTLRDEDGFTAYARDALPPYWALRHAQHERLDLLGFQDCDRNWDGNLAFVVELARRADDLPPQRVVGKGEIDGARGTIVLWGMGPRDQPAATPFAATASPTPAAVVAPAPPPVSGDRAPTAGPPASSGSAGLPALRPTVPTALTGAPAFTADDVRAQITARGDTLGTWTTPFQPQGQTVVADVAFLTAQAVGVLLARGMNMPDDRLLCLVTLSGRFSGDGLGEPEAPTPAPTTTVRLIFDARTGNLLAVTGKR